jgi:hypothetical protein
LSKKQVKSKQRVNDHGEVYTAEREVNAMLNLVKQETERIDSRFLEPACGNGNFLAEILRRKLAVVKKRYGKNPADYERYAVVAITSIYGVDILPDNARECRERLYNLWDAEYINNCKDKTCDECRQAVQYVLEKNILCGDALTMKQNDDTPIIFAEWSLVNGVMLKRRDFELAHLLAGQTENLQADLFGKYGSYETDETGAIILKPVREFSPVHYKRIQENG